MPIESGEETNGRSCVSEWVLLPVTAFTRGLVGPPYRGGGERCGGLRELNWYVSLTFLQVAYV